MVTGIYLNETYGEYKQFEQPLDFECVINNNPQTASIIGWVKHPINFIYRIRFSDGYVSDFYCDDYGKWFDSANEEEVNGKTVRINKKAPYEFGIQKDLKDVFSFSSSERTYIFRMPVNGQDTNVFVHYSNYSEFGPKYSVHYSGDYQMTLEKTSKGEWKVYDVRKFEKRTIDPTLARNICLLIESKED